MSEANVLCRQGVAVSFTSFEFFYMDISPFRYHCSIE